MSIGVDEPTQRFERCTVCGGLIDPTEGVCRKCGRIHTPGAEQTQVMPVVGAPRPPTAGLGAEPTYSAPPVTFPPRQRSFPIVPLLVVVLGLGAAAAVFAIGSRLDLSQLSRSGGFNVTLPTRVPDPGQPAPLKPATPGVAGVPAPTKPAAGAPQQAAPTTTAAPTGFFLVGNTGGDGVYLRRTPRMNDRLVAWPDNTKMQDLGEQTTGDGQTWRKVKDPKGNEGYVPVQYLVPEQPGH